jgi:hypothetical protein
MWHVGQPFGELAGSLLSGRELADELDADGAQQRQSTDEIGGSQSAEAVCDMQGVHEVVLALGAEVSCLLSRGLRFMCACVHVGVCVCMGVHLPSVGGHEELQCGVADRVANAPDLGGVLDLLATVPTLAGGGDQSTLGQSRRRPVDGFILVLLVLLLILVFLVFLIGGVIGVDGRRLLDVSGLFAFFLVECPGWTADRHGSGSGWQLASAHNREVGGASVQEPNGRGYYQNELAEWRAGGEVRGPEGYADGDGPER